ncbi:MAG TPA: ABC transporter permease [Planctomycetota bacterium]|jgi:ribose/xylose/arabinose/galactoside ABC-type transport system permease subunit
MTAAPHAASSSSLWRRLNRREFWVLLLLIVTVAAVSVKNPNFCQLSNIRNMLANAAPTAIVACGVTLVIVTGEIDISVGSLMGLLAAVLGATSSLVYSRWPAAASIVLVLTLGTAIGLVNGLLVTFGRVPSIVVTLGTMMALLGVTKLFLTGYGDSIDVSRCSPALIWLDKGTVLLIPVAIWIALAVIAATIFLVCMMPLGRHIYAVGSNPHAAMLAGLSRQRVKLFVFALTGLLVGLATIVRVPQLAKVESSIGQGLELLVVTCVVVGGTSISGGRGTIAGSVLGVLLLNSVGSMLLFLRLGENATYWEQAIQGVFILVAVLADHLARRRHGDTA